MENIRNAKYLTLLLCFVFAFTSCEDDDMDPIEEPAAISYVSLYHASPDAPPLNILMENRQINFYPLAYSDYSGYLNFYAGDRNMRVSPVNASNVVLDTTFNFVEGEAYSLFYVNEYSNIQAFLVEDDQVTADVGNSAVRFIHLSPDAPEVDLIRIEGEDVTNLADDSGYLEASEFELVPSGLQSYQVRAANSDEVILSVPDINLLSGKVYTIVARGFSTPPGGNSNNLSAEILFNN